MATARASANAASALLRRSITGPHAPSVSSSAFHSTPGRQKEDIYGDYVHRKHMYNLPEMKHRGLKGGLLVWGGFFGGIAATLLLVRFSYNKGKGGS